MVHRTTPRSPAVTPPAPATTDPAAATGLAGEASAAVGPDPVQAHSAVLTSHGMRPCTVRVSLVPDGQEPPTDDLADLRATRDRVRAAILLTGLRWPATALNAIVSPIEVGRLGHGADLALACAVLAASGHLPAGRLARVALIAELTLDGRLRPVHDLPARVRAAARAGQTCAVVADPAALPQRLPAPLAPASPAYVDGVPLYRFGSLSAVVAWLLATAAPQPGDHQLLCDRCYAGIGGVPACVAGCDRDLCHHDGLCDDPAGSRGVLCAGCRARDRLHPVWHPDPAQLLRLVQAGR